LPGNRFKFSSSKFYPLTSRRRKLLLWLQLQLRAHGLSDSEGEFDDPLKVEEKISESQPFQVQYQTSALSFGKSCQMKPYLYPQAGLSGDTLTWEIVGLDPALTYDLTVFGTGGGSDYLANSLSGVLDSEGDADWTAIVPTGDGRIVGSMNYNSQTPGIYGFQLYTADSAGVPEPSTFVLLALGLFGLGWFKWRRRA